MICPKCKAKGTMVFGTVYQICHEHHINRDGTISNKYKKTPLLSEEWNYIACSNCGLNLVGHDNATYDIIDNKIVIDEDFYEREDI